MPDAAESRGLFSNPIGGLALGDPFVLRWRGRFYLYGTNDGPPLPDGRAIPAFRSDDLVHWKPLGGALEPIEPGVDHWAPEVLAWNGKFYMVVSFGDVERLGHALWVAAADRPEGPFRMLRRVSDPAEAFSIDGAWLLDDDGRLYLFRCLDFVEEGDEPHGTGIVVQAMQDPITPIGAPRTVLRAHSPWQLFEADRPMPLYGGRKFRAWTTIEGPAPVRRAGRVFCGYSGGNFTKEYGTGEAVADHPLGPYEDLRGREGPLFGTTEGLVEGPGHFSVVRPDLWSDWIVLHGRIPGEAARRVWLSPASWTPDGVAIGPLTDLPQPAPRLATRLVRFEDQGPMPQGWRIEAGAWGRGAEELRHGGSPGVTGVAMLDDEVRTPGRWAVEIYVRGPGAPKTRAGLLLRAEATWRIGMEPSEGRGTIAVDDRIALEFALPTLGGDPFDSSRFHALEARFEGGRAAIRVDGVQVGCLGEAPRGPVRVGLFADGDAEFDALAVAVAEG